LKPREFASRLTYPNPFNPSGIDFDLPGDAFVTLQILDETGKEVSRPIDKRPYPVGTHHIEFFNGQGIVKWNEIPASVRNLCFYRLSIQIDGKLYVDTKKIMLTK
jgi:hypothetical protein